MEHMTHEEMEQIMKRDGAQAAAHDLARLQTLFIKIDEADDCDEKQDAIEAMADHVKEMYTALHGLYCTRKDLLKGLYVSPTAPTRFTKHEGEF